MSVAAFLLGLSQAAATPVPAPTPIAVELGNVRARVACEPDPERRSDAFCRPTLLTIARDGEVAYEDRFANANAYLAPAPDRGPLSVRDLNGDGEPEVLLDLYSGGAHCCSSTRLYAFDGRSRRYDVLSHDWGSSGYRIEDLDGDGRLEFVTADDRFSYAFTYYAASRRPPRYFRYERGRFVDVTKKFPARIEADAADIWKAFSEAAPSDPTGNDVRGLAAAYVAEQCLLDRCADGWKRLRAAYDAPDRDEFFRRLSSFLQKNGYVGRHPLRHGPVAVVTPAAPYGARRLRRSGGR